MSPRAAWRLESLGFTQVFDYVTGKQDWFASGLPRAGKQAERSGAGDVAQYDVTHCSTRDRVGEVRQRAEVTGQRVAVVLNEAAIVLGLVSGERFDAEPETPVELVMEPGPLTVRLHVPLADILTDMQQHDRGHVLVTTSEGKFLGLLCRHEAEKCLSPPA
jgi:predicted transcriptional regulator